MMDDSIELYFDDDGVAHQVVSMEIYFTSEEEMDEFNRCMRNGDFVRVTRCKNCKWYNTDKNWCIYTGHDYGEEFYCANGERDANE